VGVEDNSAADGVKRKLYLDGRLVGGSTVLNSITLAGANRFRVAAAPDGTLPFAGHIDSAFVYAGVLTPEQVRALYNVGSQALAASPKGEGEHVEAMEATGVLAVFDALEGCDQVDMQVIG
jgi:Concanavalin A-like lectin/glucanases superfamily